MRAIHDHERLHVKERTPAPAVRSLKEDIADLAPIPAFFAGIAVTWPIVVGAPTPWWVWAGLALYGGMALCAAVGARGRHIFSKGEKI